MLEYTIGDRYSTEGIVLALTPREWSRLQKAKRSIKVYKTDGTYLVISKMSKKQIIDYKRLENFNNQY